MPHNEILLPKDRQDMCPKFKNNVSLCMKIKLFANYDGVCRKEDSGPNQRVSQLEKYYVQTFLVGIIMSNVL